MEESIHLFNIWAQAREKSFNQNYVDIKAIKNQEGEW